MRRLLFLLLLLLSLLPSGPSAAHGYLVRAIPEDRAVLPFPPTRLQYWFSEALEPGFSSVLVRDHTGVVIAEGGVDENNRALLTVSLPPDLPDGAYVVELRPAFASDGHVVVQSRVFFVGIEPEDIQGIAASDQAVPLEVAWRVLVVGSFLLLFGTYALYRLVLLPAWGSPSYAVGHLPPRVISRLNWLLTAGLLLALLGNMLALLQQSMVFFNVDADLVIEMRLWQIVRIGSRFGDVWNVRMLLLGLLAVLHFGALYYRRRQPHMLRLVWGDSVWLMALLLGSLTVNSHAAGSLVWPWVAMGVGWLHTLAAGFWVGGVVALAFVLPPALAPYEGKARRQALLAVMRRFSRLVVGAVLLVIASGLYSASNWFYTPEDLATTYGASLALKGLMVLLLFYVGALHHLALRPHLLHDLGQRLPAALSRLLGNMVAGAGRFAASLRLETAAAVAVLLAVGLLSATPIPQPAFLQELPPAPFALQSVGPLEIAMTITPGGPGINTYDLRVSLGGAAGVDADIRLRLANPQQDRRSPWLVPEPAGGGLYVTTGDEISDDGEWWAIVDLMLPGQEPERAVFVWQIDRSALIVENLSPGPDGWAALLLVLGALAYIIRPGARWLYRRLDLRPATVITGVGLSALALLMLAAGALLVGEQQRQYELTLRPLPQIVNTVPPDAASLERGAALLEAHCTEWATAPDLEMLLRQLGTLRDETLYMALAEGWRGLPPCDTLPDEAAHWDVVNTLRLFERR